MEESEEFGLWPKHTRGTNCPTGKFEIILVSNVNIQRKLKEAAAEEHIKKLIQSRSKKINKCIQHKKEIDREEEKESEYVLITIEVMCPFLW